MRPSGNQAPLPMANALPIGTQPRPMPPPVQACSNFQQQAPAAPLPFDNSGPSMMTDANGQRFMVVPLPPNLTQSMAAPPRPPMATPQPSMQLQQRPNCGPALWSSVELANPAIQSSCNMNAPICQQPMQPTVAPAQPMAMPPQGMPGGMWAPGASCASPMVSCSRQPPSYNPPVPQWKGGRLPMAQAQVCSPTTPAQAQMCSPPTPAPTSIREPPDEVGGEVECKARVPKKAWSEDEDTMLISAVERLGPGSWSRVAQEVGTGRGGKQCRERWFNHLDPVVNKGDWTPEEDMLIEQGVAMHGTRWCEIVKLLPAGRSDNAIKNRYNSNQRKRRRAEEREVRESLMPMVQDMVQSAYAERHRGSTWFVQAHRTDTDTSAPGRIHWGVHRQQGQPQPQGIQDGQAQHSW